MGVHINSGGRRAKRFKQITYQQALEFKSSLKIPAIVSISAFATPIGVLKYQSVKSNPNISVIGGDEKYLLTAWV
jgi:putative ABC transport system permease protein